MRTVEDTVYIPEGPIGSKRESLQPRELAAEGEREDIHKLYSAQDDDRLIRALARKYVYIYIYIYIQMH